MDWSSLGVEAPPLPADDQPDPANTLSPGDWPCIGGDPGLSKYSPCNIPAESTLKLQYIKRFYGKYATTKGNYFYGSSVVTRDGKALLIADDRLPSPGSVTFMTFDWTTSQSQGYYATPWPFQGSSNELESHHYSNPVIWHTDGRVYMRRGGDYSSTQVFLPDSGQLIAMSYRDAAGSALTPGIDATARMQAYKDMLIYRYSDVRERARSGRPVSRTPALPTRVSRSGATSSARCALRWARRSRLSRGRTAATAGRPATATSPSAQTMCASRPPWHPR